jgi:hypothetical protein
VKSGSRTSDPTRLPFTGSLLPFYISSLVIAALLVAASVAGLVYPDRVYPTQELLESALPNDPINLALGVPILIASIWLARRNKLVGLLFWPGALTFVVYNALARVIDLPLGWAFAANLAQLALSIYTLIGLVAGVEGASVQGRLAGAVRARLSGAVLIGLGVLFILRAAVVVGTALLSGTPLPDTEVSVLVADVLLSPAWVIGGLLLWQRKPLGYTGGAGLLFQASALFVGVILFVFLQPLLTDAPLDLEAAIVLAVMALPCWIPFGLFLRGIV